MLNTFRGMQYIKKKKLYRNIYLLFTEKENDPQMSSRDLLKTKHQKSGRDELPIQCLLPLTVSKNRDDVNIYLLHHQGYAYKDLFKSPLKLCTILMMQFLLFFPFLL